MTANPERGEIEVDIEGVPHVLRPSYEAIVAIEKATGRGLVQLAQAAGDGSLAVDDAAIIVTECVRAHGRATGNRDLTEYRVGTVAAALVETGVIQVQKRLELLLYLAVTGGYTAKGEAKAPPVRPTTDGAATDA